MTTLTDSAGTALDLVLSLDPVLLSIVWRSLAVSATACLIACAAGLVLGAWLVLQRVHRRIAADERSAGEHSQTFH